MTYVLFAFLHPALAIGMQTLLQRTPTLLVVGHAVTEQETLDLAGTLHPQLIILDGDAPLFLGIEIIGKLCAHYPLVPILVLGEFHWLSENNPMLKAGAVDYLPKGQLTKHLVASVNAIVNADPAAA